MQKQQQQGFDWVEAQKRNWNLIVFALAVWQRAVVVPMRYRFGVEALGSICVASFLFMAVWAWCWHDPLMWAYLGYWTLCWMVRRAEARRLVPRASGFTASPTAGRGRPCACLSCARRTRPS